MLESPKENRVIIITGPTASGKSDVAIAAAKMLGSEVISADSRQIYQETNIGTAKLSTRDMQGVPHHLVDVLDVDDVYNAGLFEKQSTEIIHTLHQLNRIPVVCGGTGLYIKALVDGIIDLEVAEDLHLHLMDELRATGQDAMYRFLQEIDPAAAETMLPQNWKRVIRALEVKLTSGSSILELHKQSSVKSGFRFFQFGMLWERDELYERINIRVDRMIERGLIEEVQALRNRGYSPENNALNTVGYKEVFAYLEGKISKDEAVRLIKRNTRHYAKRQMTWFRADDRIVWIPVQNRSQNEIAEYIIKTISFTE